MGSPAAEPGMLESESPQHEVTLNSFYIGKYTVTQKEYEALMGKNANHSQAENLPVIMVSWYNAVEYCNEMSKRDKLSPAYRINNNDVVWNQKANGYRLPTEAEWEYACRAGTSSRYSTGDNINAAQARFASREPVEAGSYPPNPWGIYDMHGNVFEWCWDRFGLYNDEPLQNPPGAENGDLRIIRGGSATSMARHLRSAMRSYVEPDTMNANLGFRVVRNAP